MPSVEFTFPGITRPQELSGSAVPTPEEDLILRGRSLAEVNRLRLDRAQAGATIMDDPACWLAYKRKEDAPGWLRSHYIYQIRTFWISMAGIGFAVLAAPLPFGLFSPTIVAVVVWLTIRCFFGLVRLHRGEPIFNPQTWIV